MTLATEIHNKSLAEDELKKLEKDFNSKKAEILRRKDEAEKNIAIFLDDTADNNFAVLQKVLKIRTSHTALNRKILSKYFVSLSKYIAREIFHQSQENKTTFIFPYHIEIQDNSYGRDETQYLHEIATGFSTDYHPNLFSIIIRGMISKEEAEAALSVISKIAQSSPFDENGNKTEYFANFEKYFNFSLNIQVI